MSMIEIGNIVTLDNDAEYLLLEKLEENGNEYVYATETKDDDHIVGHYVIFCVHKEDDGEYLQLLEDIEKQTELLAKFQKIVTSKVKKQAKAGYLSWAIYIILFLIAGFGLLNASGLLKVVSGVFALIFGFIICISVIHTIKTTKMLKKIQNNMVEYEKTNW